MDNIEKAPEVEVKKTASFAGLKTVNFNPAKVIFI